MKRLWTALLALLLITSAVQPAAAQDGALWDRLVSDDGSFTARALSFVGNLLGDLARTQDKYLGEHDRDAATYADEVQQAFNEHNETLEAFASERLAADTDHDVAAIYLHDSDGGNETLYLVSDVDNGSWTNARLVDQTTFDGLNRSVDFWVSADWFVSKHAGDELDSFVDEFARPDENVTRRYYAKMVSKYGSGIKSDLWGHDDPDFE